jgi:flagellar hook-associated protein 1 FlgK
MLASNVSTQVGAFANASSYTAVLNEAGQLTLSAIDAGGNPVSLDSAEARVNDEMRTIDATGELQGPALAKGDRITLDGIMFTIDELPLPVTPATNATSSLTLNEYVAAGDNRNALAMQDLQRQAVVGGIATLSQAYGGIVSDVGNRTNVVQVNLEASESITEQLDALKQSESGVNLDEEAANLLRYQQYYAANARVIDTASTMMDTILGLRN